MRILTELLMGKKQKERTNRWPCDPAGPVDTLPPYQAHLNHSSLNYAEQQEAEQTDEEYLTNPDLQRRRSQLQLGFLRTRSHSHPHRLRHGHRSPHQSRPSSPLANEITKRSLTTKQRSPFSQCSTSDNHTRSRISPHSSSATKQTKKPKGYYYAHPEEFIYDLTTP